MEWGGILQGRAEGKVGIRSQLVRPPSGQGKLAQGGT